MYSVKTMSQDDFSEKEIVVKTICELDAENARLEHEIYALRVMIKILKASTWY